MQLEVTCKNEFCLAVFSWLLSLTPPRALTLTTLLSENPEQPLCQSSADILQGIQLSKPKAKHVCYKNKKRQPNSESSSFWKGQQIGFGLFYHPIITDCFRSFQQGHCLIQRMKPNVCQVLRCTSKWWFLMENRHRCGKVSLLLWTR